jgi:hypothetical protein
MGFLDAFISVKKTEEIPTPDEVKPVSKFRKGSVVSAPSQASTGTTPLTLPISAKTVTVNPEIVQTLEKAVSDSTPTEYTQFRAFFDSLSALPDNLRYTTAISVANAAKLTGPAILRAMDARIARLDQEKKNFETWATEEYNVAVSGRESAATDAQARIEELAAEIKDLTTKLNTLNLEASAEKERLEESAVSFMTAHDTVMASLKAERDTVANLLTSTT